jgi:endoglycosylceramidase
LPRLTARPNAPTRRRLKVVGVASLVVALAACTLVPRRTGIPGARGWRPILPALHAEPDPVSGGRIVDALGREVLLRGVNVNALTEYWQHGPFATTFPLTGADADTISATGWNAVRLLVSWSRIEPVAGTYDDHYLDQVTAAVDLLERRGVYTIIDFHQDAWGPTLAAPPGTTCPAGSEPAFGWDGAPGWATLDGGASRCAPAGVREISPAVLTSFAAFWSDAPGPGGVGIRTRYARMVGHVGARFARNASVAGYDLMNEPNAFSPEQLAGLSDLYADALTAIRAGEASRHGFPHLVFFEPGALWSDFSAGTPPDFPRDDNVVFAPHIYRGGITSGPIERSDFERARNDAATFGGAPVLVGEWGSSPERAKDPADVYFREHQQLQDEFHFGATLWTWRESCGDPHKAQDHRQGTVPYVWGEFDVDCTTNRVIGPRQPLVDQLDRGYVRAAPGRLVTTTYDPPTGELRGSGDHARPGSVLVAWYPERPSKIRLLSTAGLLLVRVSSSGSDRGSYVTGVATRPSWSITIGASGSGLTHIG